MYCRIFFLFAVVLLGDAVPLVHAAERQGTTVWSGEHSVNRMIEIGRGEVLVIQPGARIRFGDETGLKIRGRLDIRGTERSPVVLEAFDRSGKKGKGWAGILLDRSAGSTLSFVRITGSREIRLSETSVALTGCRISGGGIGLVVERRSDLKFSDGSIAGNAEGGILIASSGSITVLDSRIEANGAFGVRGAQRIGVSINDSTIKGHETGVDLSQRLAAKLNGNRIEGNGIGVLLQYTGEGGKEDETVSITGNTFRRNMEGIVCRYQSAPTIDGNTFRENQTAIAIERNSSPAILKNLVAGNETGIRCIRASSPRITANTLAGNRTGLSIDFFSYPLVNRNNLTGQGKKIVLGEHQSMDFARREGISPSPSPSPSQPSAFSPQPSAPTPRPSALKPPAGPDGVDARENFWGAEITAEMERNGAEADLGAIDDYFDRPMARYEGYPGSYARDRVHYEAWLGAPVADAPTSE